VSHKFDSRALSDLPGLFTVFPDAAVAFEGREREADRLEGDENDDITDSYRS